MKKKKYKEVLWFYQELFSLLMSARCDSVLALNLILRFKCDISKGERKLHINDIAGMHHEVKVGRSQGNADIQMITKWAYEDLAGHLRDKAARTVVEDWRKLAGMHTDKFVFIKVRSMRVLGSSEEPDSPVAVTLILDSKKSLITILDPQIWRRAGITARIS